MNREAERLWQRAIERCERAWKQERIADAIADAVSLCRVYGKPPPDWLDTAVGILASPNTIRRATRRRDMVHYTRYDAICDLHERKGEVGMPKSLDECYARAAEHFEGTAAAGGAEAMKKSYERVRTDMRSGRGLRYYVSRKRAG
jgi:hypothetical protein